MQGLRGTSICEHNRQRSRCKDCGGTNICQHNRERSKCKDCGGTSICQHNRERTETLLKTDSLEVKAETVWMR